MSNAKIQWTSEEETVLKAIIRNQIAGLALPGGEPEYQTIQRVNAKSVAILFCARIDKSYKSVIGKTIHFISLMGDEAYQAYKAARSHKELAVVQPVVSENPDDGWRKVEAPKKWSPAKGEVLQGTYIGSRTSTGPHGLYTQHLVARGKEVRHVSGTVIEQLFSASQARPGSLVRVVFNGTNETTSGNSCHDFDLFVKDDE